MHCQIIVHIHRRQAMVIRFIVLNRYLKWSKMISIVYNVCINRMMNKTSIDIVLIVNISLTQKALLSLFHRIFLKHLHMKKSKSRVFLHVISICFFSSSTTNSMNGKPDRIPSRRPLMAPKLRMANNNTERLSSSDSGGSLQHNQNTRRIPHEKSTMVMNDHHPVRNGYATWNRYEELSSNHLRILLLHF